jgi:hypothetical protein
MNAIRYAVTGAILGLVLYANGNAAEPLYDGLGTYSRKITTKNAKAQRYFDQGLALLHGFNHRGAIRSFQEAARLDPQCAMAHWGAALAAGPHINYSLVPPPMAELAWKEITLAKQNASNASEVEQALIEALSKVTHIRSQRTGHRSIKLMPKRCVPSGTDSQMTSMWELCLRKR